MSRSHSRLIRRLLAFAALALAVLRRNTFVHATAAIFQPQTTFLVAKTFDVGPGSLGQAILDANASPGADFITISAHGTLFPPSSLLTIAEELVFQGPSPISSA